MSVSPVKSTPRDELLRTRFRAQSRTDWRHARNRFYGRVLAAGVTGLGAGLAAKYATPTMLRLARAGRKSSMDAMTKAGETIVQGQLVKRYPKFTRVRHGLGNFGQFLGGLVTGRRPRFSAGTKVRRGVQFVSGVHEAKRKLALATIGYSASGLGEQSLKFVGRHPIGVGAVVGGGHLVGGTTRDVERTRKRQGMFARSLLSL